jgi:FtsP/CotA-like multicopper oxidase with cupredoxin domain
VSVDGTLAVHLVATRGAWRPEGDGGCAIDVDTFADESGLPQVPGPLVRARVGTRITATVRNTLPDTLWLSGLQDHVSDRVDSIAVPPGETREIRFVPTVAGTYFYRGHHGGGNFILQTTQSGQLIGALIVDPASARSPNDRVFVITSWIDTTNLRPDRPRAFFIISINGHSWPHSERLSYDVGDSVRWRVINNSPVFHTMHLHGFYFRVESRGWAARDTAYGRDAQRDVVTEIMRPATSMTLSWRADRSGNWLFHCHEALHTSPAVRLDHMRLATPPSPNAAEDHMSAGMAGLMMGVQVRPAPDEPAARPFMPVRDLRLFANERAHVFGSETGYGLVLQEGDAPPARDSIRLPGSPIVLVRGQPSRITVLNRLSMPLSVHWHGIEIESYYDGVGGWSGSGSRIAPPIAPGDSFVVHITPVRAGTFMYHVHGEPGDELAQGLYGPLIVLEPNERWDVEHDRILVISAGTGFPGRAIVNGSTTPPPLDLVAGRPYRLRLIDIAKTQLHSAAIVGGESQPMWMMIGHDGATIPIPRRHLTPAVQEIATGMTFDFEYRSPSPGDRTFRVIGSMPGRPPDTVLVPLRVH